MASKCNETTNDSSSSSSSSSSTTTTTESNSLSNSSSLNSEASGRSSRLSTSTEEALTAAALAARQNHNHHTNPIIRLDPSSNSSSSNNNNKKKNISNPKFVNTDADADPSGVYSQHHAVSSDLNEYMYMTSPTASMSSSQQQQPNSYQSLKIKTKSIENTLLPLVNQISNLVNFRELQQQRSQLESCGGGVSFSVSFEKQANALIRVGQAVNLAVERFVVVGETIAYENPTIKIDMLDACRDARLAGIAIKYQTQQPGTIIKMTSQSSSSSSSSNQDKIALIHAANNLLNAVTKVLLLADVVIINQILNAKNKVGLTLNKLEYVIDFDSFLSLFTQYGADLIELAHLSGERQNDLKDDKRRSQLSSARWVLEKSTVMLLSSTKAYLKHMECECSKENISLVYLFLRQALDTLHFVVADSSSLYDYVSPLVYENSLFRSSASSANLTFINALRLFEDALELLKNKMVSNSSENLVPSALKNLIESTLDFTDSAHVRNEQREQILGLQLEIREKTLAYLRATESRSTSSDDLISGVGGGGSPARSLDHLLCTPILNACDQLKKLLQSVSMQLTDQLFRDNLDAHLLASIRTYSLSNHYDLLVDTLDKFKDYSAHVLELCRLMRHVSELDVFEVTCEHHHAVFDYLTNMIQSSAGTAALYSTCRASVENLALYCDVWEAQVNELSVLVKEMHEFMRGIKSNKSVYLSLPRPGKHGTSARVTSSLNRGMGNNNNNKGTMTTMSTKLDSNEQAKIAKLGLEMQLIQNEIDTEAERWNEPQNEIVKIAKQMSEMAYEIHLFTRGQGSLRTTGDLFARAETFLENGVLFYGIVRDLYARHVPPGALRDELNELLEQLPQNFKQLRHRLRINTNGKTATFNKVDWVIQETRDFMNLVTKIVTNCFLCCTKYNITYESRTSSQVENLNTQTTTSNNTNCYVNPNVFGGAASSNSNTLLVNDLNQDQLSSYKYSSALLDQTLIGYRSQLQQQQQQHHPYYFSSHLSDRFSSSNYNPQPHTRSHSLNNRNNY